MTRPTYEHLLLRREDGVLSVSLNRPEVHNSLNPALIGELTECFISLEAGGPVRAVLLYGEGPSFCAGADLNWMREAADYGYEESVADALTLARMFEAIDSCAVPVVARVHGGAIGGGSGLVACCDVALGAEDARFGFPEVKLGLLPAVIAPFVVARVGPGHARALFATGERFTAERALRIGLIHQTAPLRQLDSAVWRVLRELLSSAPGATSRARQLVRDVQGKQPGEVRDLTADLIARLRSGEEGREGMAAFLEKGKPSWAGDAG